MNLTITIPTLNCAGTLRHTLESVRSLKRAGAKVLVVDSYSTDGTPEIAREFEAELIQVPKGNMYVAINAGLQHARTEWLTYINGDDLLYAETVQRALQAVGPLADVIYGAIDYVDLSGRFLHWWDSAMEPDLLPLFARAVMPIAQQGTLFRQEVFQRLEGFDTRFSLSSDFDFFLRANLAGFRFSRVPGPRIAAYRVFPAQMASRCGFTPLLEQKRVSVKRNGLNVSRWRQEWSFLRFRLRNWDSYLVRFLRARQIAGRFKLTGTMDSP